MNENTNANAPATPAPGTPGGAGAPPGEAGYGRPRLPPADLGSLERLTLALMRLSAWKTDAVDRDDGRVFVRSWKGYSFYALGRLADAGLIRYKPDYKTVLLTEEGQAFSEASLTKLGLDAAPLETRGLPARSRSGVGK